MSHIPYVEEVLPAFPARLYPMTFGFFPLLAFESPDILVDIPPLLELTEFIYAPSERNADPVRCLPCSSFTTAILMRSEDCPYFFPDSAPNLDCRGVTSDSDLSRFELLRKRSGADLNSALLLSYVALDVEVVKSAALGYRRPGASFHTFKKRRCRVLKSRKRTFSRGRVYLSAPTYLPVTYPLIVLLSARRARLIGD